MFSPPLQAATCCYCPEEPISCYEAPCQRVPNALQVLSRLSQLQLSLLLVLALLQHPAAAVDSPAPCCCSLNQTDQ
jgi:hypothetical protein